MPIYNQFKTNNYLFLILIILGISINFQFSNAQLINRWEKVRLPAGFNNNNGDFYLDISFLPQNPKYGWICGNNSKVIITTDSGKTWRGVRVTNFPHQLESIQFLNVNVGYVSGPTQDGGGVGSIFKSIDGGSSWFNITPPNTGTLFWGMRFIDENNGLLLGGDCNFQYFYRTTDGGASWSLSAYNSEGGKLSDPIIIDFEGLCYAIGSGALWQSNNGGRTWSIKSFTGAKDWHEELAVLGNSMVVPVSNGCEGTFEMQGGIRFSRNEGRNWNNFTGVRGPMFGSFLNDETTGWAAGFSQGVYYTCDAGSTWNIVDCGLEGDLDDIYFFNDTTGWVVGTNVYKSATALTNSKIIIKDTTYFCEGETVTIKADSTYRNQRWLSCNKSKTEKINSDGETIVYNFNNPCDTGLIIKYPTKTSPKPIYDILLSANNPNALCEGDTIKLSVSEIYKSYLWSTGDTTQSIVVTISGDYSVTVTNEFDCKSINTFNIKFNPLPNPEIEVIGRDKVCIGDSILLNSKNTHTKYEWYDKSTNSVISNDKTTYIKNSGTYYLVVTNEFGCSKISNEVNLEFISDSNRIEIVIDPSSKINFGKDTLSTLYCKELTIYNTSNANFTLDSLYFFKKLNFSIPNSQLPVIVPAKDSIVLNICFYSLEVGKYNDTIKIADVCNDKFVFLNAEVEGYNLDGTTKCNLEWSIEVLKLENRYQMSISSIYPNPIQNKFNIDLVEFLPTNTNLLNQTKNISQNNIIEFSIYNSFGEEIERGLLDYPNRIEIQKNGDYNSYKIELVLNDEKYSSGLYILNIKSNYSNVTKSQIFIKE